MLLGESVQSLEACVKLRRTVVFGEIRHHQLRLLQLLAERLEVDELGHLDLLVKASTLVVTQSRYVANRECVWALHRDLSGYSVVESLHALNLCECDKISIIQSVPRLVQSRNQALRVDACNDAVERVLSSGVANGELLAKVGED